MALGLGWIMWLAMRPRTGRPCINVVDYSIVVS